MSRRSRRSEVKAVTSTSSTASTSSTTEVLIPPRLQLPALKRSPASAKTWPTVRKNFASAGMAVADKKGEPAHLQLKPRINRGAARSRSSSRRLFTSSRGCVRGRGSCQRRGPNEVGAKPSARVRSDRRESASKTSGTPSPPRSTVACRYVHRMRLSQRVSSAELASTVTGHTRRRARPAFA